MTGKGAFGYTPLHQIGYTPHADLCEFILEHGGNLDALSKNGSTPLLIASREGHTQVVERMLSYGADPCDGGDKSLTPLLMAASEGHIEIVKLLLSFGADAKEAPFEGRSPLHEAVETGHAEVCRLLIEVGDASPTLADAQGSTPLAIAEHLDRADLIGVIRNTKPDPSSRVVRKPLDKIGRHRELPPRMSLDPSLTS